MITLAITSWNRDSMTYNAVKSVLHNDDITEIVIVDDHSDQRVYENLLNMVEGLDKVSIYRNHKNLDCYRNKREAVSKAKNEWVILLDSDNVIDNNYVRAITSKPWDKHILFQPSFAKPHFDFSKYGGSVITRNNLKLFINDSQFQTMLNAMNYFVNRDEYLRVWDYSQPLLRQLGGDPVTSDSLFQNYAWLESGNSINVISGMEYHHNVHEGSHYQQNFKRTPTGFHDTILDKLKQL